MNYETIMHYGPEHDCCKFLANLLVIRKYLGNYNDKYVGWHELPKFRSLQNILNFKPRVIFESYTFYPI